MDKYSNSYILSSSAKQTEKKPKTKLNRKTTTLTMPILILLHNGVVEGEVGKAFFVG